MLTSEQLSIPYAQLRQLLWHAFADMVGIELLGPALAEALDEVKAVAAA
jgi:hypothetical protein